MFQFALHQQENVFYPRDSPATFHPVIRIPMRASSSKLTSDLHYAKRQT